MVKDLYVAGGERAEKTVQEEDAELLAGDAGKKVLACLVPFSVKKHIVPDDSLEIDLGLDSLSRVELVVSLEQTFGIGLPDTFGSEVFTVREVVLKMRELLASGTAKATPAHVRLSWSDILRQEPSEDAKALVRTERSALCLLGWSIMRLFLKLFLRLYGGLTFKGIENLPLKGPYLITPNHLSNADAFALTAAMPGSIGSQVFSMGDTKFFGGPVSSRVAQFIQVIPVDMEAKLFNALQLSAYVLRQGKVLCVFPEGSRSRDGKIKDFKKGVAIIAKELNLPLVPAAITGTFEMMRPGQLFPRPGKVSVTFGKPVYPGEMGYEELTKKLYGEVVGLLPVRSAE